MSSGMVSFSRRAFAVALVLAASCATTTPAFAQTIRTLTRSTAITGSNDSALTFVSDSALRTRAVSFRELFKRPAGTAALPSFTFALDSTSGMYRFGVDTIGWSTAGVHSLRLSGGATALLTGGAGNMTIQAGTGASRTLSLQTTTSGSAVKSVVVLGADSSATFLGKVIAADTVKSSTAFRSPVGQATDVAYGISGDPNTGMYSASADNIQLAAGGGVVFGAGTTFAALYANQAATVAAYTNRVSLSQQVRGVNGTAALPTYSFADSTSGVYRFGADTLGFTTAGVHSLRLSGGATALLTGGAGNMTIQAGTGASRTLSLQTTTSGSAVKSVVVLGADSSATFLGKVIAADTVKSSTAFRSPVGQATDVAYGISGDPNTGMYSASADNIQLAAGGGVVFGAGTTFAALYANQAATVAAYTNRVSLSQQVRGVNGTAALPTYSFADSTSGVYRFGADTLGFATAGVHSLRLSGGATALLTGGAGNMTVIAGTGNSRTFTLQTTTSGGTATTALTADATQLVTMAARATVTDTLRLSGKAIASALTAAAGTPNSVCINAATKEITENAALTCTVSSLRYKRNVQPLSQATAKSIVGRLRPVTFEYRSGGRSAFGLIAESVDSVDKRLVSYDAQKRPNAVNYEQLAVLLLSEVQRLRKSVDSLTTIVRTTQMPCVGPNCILVSIASPPR